MPVDSIKVQGLNEFVRAVRRTSSDMPKVIRAGLNSAMQIVVDDARPRIVKRSGRAAATLKGQSTQNRARIKAGGRRAPYFAWLDFGGSRRGRAGGLAVRQFREKGRYVWLSFGEKKAEVMEALTGALVDVARQAGLEVTHG